MEAKLYQTKIFESDLHYSHGWFRTIWEVYIVETQIVINESGGMYVEKSGPRSPIGEIFNIEIPYELSADIFGLINKREKINSIIKNMFDDIEKLKKLTAADRIN